MALKCSSQFYMYLAEIETKLLHHYCRLFISDNKVHQVKQAQIVQATAISDVFVCLLDLILYVPSTIFQLNRDRSSWVEPVLS